MTETDSEESAKAEADVKPEAEGEAAKVTTETETGTETETETGTEAEAEATEAKKAKKKKKKRTRATEPKAAGRAGLDEAGRERPPFLLEFPEDPDLEPLIRAFENGNYALVREDAPRVIERTPHAEVKAAAKELLQRIEPDPLVKFLLGVAVALFFAVTGYVYFAH